MGPALRAARLFFRTVLLALTSISIIVTTPALNAAADANDVSAWIDGPTPNPIPAGTTAAAVANFSVSVDAGPVTVAVELLGAGFGTLRLDSAGTSSELLNCDDSSTTYVVCDWDGELADGVQTLAVFVDVDPDAVPGTGASLDATVDDGTLRFTLASTFMSTLPPIGSTTFSGTVITVGGGPVDQACVFVLSSPSGVFTAITDANGNWSVTGLPDSYSFVVAVVPPFVGTFGPCAEAGPPPIPAPGELQPVFYDNIWIDLADPILTGGLGDPYTFAVAAGATSFSSSASGLISCLSTVAFDVVPRPPCVAAATTTTTPSSSTSTDTTLGPVVGALPLTGSRIAAWAGLGATLLLAGLAMLNGRRPPEDRREHV